MTFKLPPIIERSVAQVADARGEAETEQVHQREHVVGEAGGVGVILLDAQVRFMVQQAVQHVGRIANADVDHPGAERRVLVGDVGIKQLARLGAVFWVDVTRALRSAAGAEALAVRRRCGAIAPVLGERMLKLGVDEIGQARRIGLVPDVPSLQPRQLRIGRARARFRHFLSDQG